MLPAYGLHGHIRNNNLKSAILLAGFLVLTAAFWYALCLIWTAFAWTPPDMAGDATIDQRVLIVAAHTICVALERWYIPLGAGLAWLSIAYAFHANMIRVAMGTKELTRRQHPKLYNMVERLAIEAGLPMPRIEVMNTGALNAYAAGLSPETATIAVTRGLIQSLTPAELEAVLAHEMTHIRNRDVRLMVVALVMAGGLTFVGEMAGQAFRPRSNSGWHVGDISDAGIGLPDLTNSEGEGPVAAGALLVSLVSIVLAIGLLATVHLFALLSKFAISRSREYMADAGAVELTKNPDALISALMKISGNDAVPRVPASLRAMMISNPLEGLFSTHPSIADRVAALQGKAGGRMPEPVRRVLWGKASPATDSTLDSAMAEPWEASPSPQPATGFLKSAPTVGFGRRRRRVQAA
jgi:heat shock protein HtpX